MPRVNKNIPSCLNCNSPFSEEDQFCSNCSQKRTDGLITVKDLFSEFFSTVFNIEGKLANTIKDLFIPGKLTTAFFAGHHEKYYKPLRMFFVFMVTHLAILSLTLFNSTNLTTGSLDKALYKIQHKKEIKLELDTLLSAKKRIFESSKEGIVFDTIASALNEELFANLDSIQLSDAVDGVDNAVVFNFDISGQKVAVDDLQLLENDFDKFAEKYEVTDFWNKLGLQQTYRVSTDPKGTFNYVLGNMTWMLILLIPAIALILKLLYFRHKFYFVQHLAFLFHNHAFAFFIISLVAIISHFVSNEGFGLIAFSISMFGLTIYFFLAMKKFYGQSFFKTLGKYIVVLISYLFISVTFFVITILFSFALYS